MRRLIALALLLVPTISPAQTITGVYWELLAIDGKAIDFRATLRIDDDNVLAGAAPCNRYSGNSMAELPALKLGALRSTRMACEGLANEEAYFDALAVMTAITTDGDDTLILTGPENRTMEFVPEGTVGQSVCKTCRPPE